VDEAAKALLASEAMAAIRRWCLLVPPLALLLFSGCSSLARVPFPSFPPQQTRQLEGSHGVEIVAYSTPDGVFHGFHGRVRWSSGTRDSVELEGWRTSSVPGAEPSGDLDEKEPVKIRLSRDEVASIVYRAPDGSKTGVLGLGIVSTVLIAGTALFIILFAIAYED